MRLKVISLFFVISSWMAYIGHCQMTNEQAGPGYIYFIGEVDVAYNGYTGYYKVGYTTNDVEHRRRTLNTGNPRPLLIINKARTSQSVNIVESAVKAALKGYRAQSGGGQEWYKVTVGELKQFEYLLWSTVRETQYRNG